MKFLQVLISALPLLMYTQSALSEYLEAPQEAPASPASLTEIFLFDLLIEGDTVSISNVVNTTKRMGYDNQPYFTPDSTTFLYSREQDSVVDVFEYVLATAEHRQVTDGANTEYSPTPSADNASMLFVSDRNGSVWRAQRSAPNAPSWLMQASDNREPIGYFAFNDKTQDFLYWSRYGFSIKLVNQSTSTYHFVAGNTPPATPHLIPQTDNFSFVHRQLNEQVVIKMIDPTTLSVTPLLTIVGDNHDYTWSQDQRIFMIQNNVLFQSKPFENGTMQAVADLSEFGIKGASRLSISPNSKHLAVVGMVAN
jgi:Tol biopolymer transport system component